MKHSLDMNQRGKLVEKTMCRLGRPDHNSRIHIRKELQVADRNEIWIAVSSWTLSIL
jgi:hypothetical protein